MPHTLTHITLKPDEVEKLCEEFDFTLQETGPGVTRAVFASQDDLRRAELRVAQLRCRLIRAARAARPELAGLN